MNKEEETRILGKLKEIESILSSANDYSNKVRCKLDCAEGEEECFKEPSCVMDYLYIVKKLSQSVNAKLSHIDDLL